MRASFNEWIDRRLRLPSYPAGSAIASRTTITNQGQTTSVTATSLPGYYSVYMTIKDEDGVWRSDLKNFYVIPPKFETIQGKALYGTRGATLTGTLATFSETGTSTNLAPNLAAKVDWGDGVVTIGTVVPLGSGGYKVNGTHTYIQEGAFTVTVEIVDTAYYATASDLLTGFAASFVRIVAGEDDQSLDAVRNLTDTGSGTLAEYAVVDYGANDYRVTGWGAGTFTLNDANFTPNGSYSLAEQGSMNISVNSSGLFSAVTTPTDTSSVLVASYALSDTNSNNLGRSDFYQDLSLQLSKIESGSDVGFDVKVGHPLLPPGFQSALFEISYALFGRSAREGRTAVAGRGSQR
ncbi:MAG TPA: hypothetical protein VGX78_18705, partial [Pirellulales bacterium]|nr:hypothetical protein [Pirellulales bacterium]